MNNEQPCPHIHLTKQSGPMDGGAESSRYVCGSSTELLAQKFHEAYERLAPQFGYKTREESAKPWSEVPGQNRKLMIAVCAELFTGCGESFYIQPGQPTVEMGTQGTYQQGIKAMQIHLEECLAGRVEPTNPTMAMLLDWAGREAPLSATKEPDRES